MRLVLIYIRVTDSTFSSVTFYIDICRHVTNINEVETGLLKPVTSPENNLLILSLKYWNGWDQMSIGIHNNSNT